MTTHTIEVTRPTTIKPITPLILLKATYNPNADWGV